MSIIKKVRRWLSPRSQLLERLAETAADAEILAANLSRHTALCHYVTLRSGLAELTIAETAQANSIRQLLLEHGIGPKVALVPSHDGSSNWERLRNDLALQVKIHRALQAQFSEWSAIDPQIAGRLRESAIAQDRRIEQLRDLTLKCDPQALD